MHDTAEPGDGHAGGRFYEWQRDPVERDDSRSGKGQPQRAATHGSRKHAAHDRSPHAHQGRHTLQHPAREALDK